MPPLQVNHASRFPTTDTHTTPTMSSLPDELLTRIIRLATATPSTFHSKYAVPSDPYSHYATPMFPDYDPESMSTKLALACVSRRFWNIASEYLYERIEVMSPEQLERVGAVLTKYTPRAVEGGIGRHVKCLLVSLRLDNICKQQRMVCANLESILCRCTALRDLAFDATIEYYGAATGIECGKRGDVRGRMVWRTMKKYEQRIIQAIHPQSLEHVHWQCFGTPLDHAMYPLLQEARSLKNLCLMGRAISRSPPPPIYLPHLTSLNMTIFSSMRQWHLPLLRGLEIGELSQIEVTDEFWSQVSKTLTFLRFSSTRPFSPQVHRMLLSLSNLDEVVFDVIPYTTTPQDDFFREPHPRLRHLALDFSLHSFYSHYDPARADVISETTHIMRCLTHHYLPTLLDRSIFPNLRSISLKNIDLVVARFPEEKREDFASGMKDVLQVCRLFTGGFKTSGFEVKVGPDTSPVLVLYI